MDGDTGWHIRTGEFILDHGTIPSSDLFSFSKPGAPWFAWEWLSDLTFGLLFRWAGLKGVVLFAGVAIAAYALILLRFSLWLGANVMLALPLTLLAMGSSSIHFLARPHLFTLLLFPLALWLLEADRRKPGPWVWWLIPITVIWTNLHGGFAVLLVCLGLLVVGTAIESWWGRARSGMLARYSLLLLACGAATLANPFGLGLHRHIVEYLQADWIRNLVQEFQAPTFRGEGQMQFEILLVLGLLVASRLLMRREVTHTLWILFLAHSSLTSLRHAPLFAAIAAPLVAAELTQLWRISSQESARTAVQRILFDLGADLRNMFRGVTVLSAAFVLVLALVRLPIQWPQDFPAEGFPTGFVHRNEARIVTGKLFTTDQWADYLIFSYYPRQRVFIDGRTDFYGESMGRDYLALMQGNAGYRELLARYAFTAVLIPADWPLANLLKTSGGWIVVDEDRKAILFAAKPGGNSTQTADIHSPSLMLKQQFAELLSRRSRT